MCVQNCESVKMCKFCSIFVAFPSRQLKLCISLTLCVAFKEPNFLVMF